MRPVKKTRTLLIDYDNGDRRMAERLEALARARGITDPSDIPLYYVSLPDPWLDLSDNTQTGRLIQLVKSNEIGLLVIDNLGTVSGTVDENSPAMIRVMSNLRRLVEATGCCVVVIHHQRKSTGGNARQRAGDTLRGHNSIEASLDLALLVERPEADSNRILIRATKSRDLPVPPFALEFTYTAKTEAGVESSELATARFVGIPVEDVAFGRRPSDASAEAERIRGLVREAVSQMGAPQKTNLIEQVRKTAGRGKDTVTKIVDGMILGGSLITEKTGKNNATICRLPDKPNAGSPVSAEAES